MNDQYKNSYKATAKELVSLSVYNVGYQLCDAGYQWGPGIRDHYLIHYVISGKGTYEVNNETHFLSAGDAFLVYPNTEIIYRADAKTPWEYAWVGFMGEDADTIIRATDFRRKHPWIKKGTLPNNLIQEQLGIIYDVKGSDYESAVAMTGALYTLLSTFMHYAQHEEDVQNSQVVYVEQAKDYISTNYSYPITVEDVASYVGISRSYLFRSFQAIQNQSPKEYLIEYRLKRARHLLRETSLSIASIAYSVGFENNLYFSKAFKSKMKMTPSEYRKNQI